MEVVQYILGFGPAVVIPMIMFYLPCYLARETCRCGEKCNDGRYWFSRSFVADRFYGDITQQFDRSDGKNLNLHYEVLIWAGR